ncbi:hypothetical protein B0H17DRAFT_1124074 [Mycena rosella]|uniref:Uncharacterized protein n=1 Tax=Mycena rosella TaxID=1033263 RepID=A0AAD7H171_MYCRO|nr:hypothetical protein B0H17DRAFT_1124074 [Mycena rosella]
MYGTTGYLNDSAKGAKLEDSELTSAEILTDPRLIPCDYYYKANIPPAQRLDGMDDPRNGLLIDGNLHSALSKTIIVLLLVPNIYLSRNDVQEPFIWTVDPADNKLLTLTPEQCHQMENPELHFDNEDGFETDNDAEIDGGDAFAPGGPIRFVSPHNSTPAQPEPAQNEPGYKQLGNTSRVLFQVLRPEEMHTSWVEPLPHNCHAHPNTHSTHSISPVALHVTYACAILVRWGQEADLAAPVQMIGPDSSSSGQGHRPEWVGGGK